MSIMKVSLVLSLFALCVALSMQAPLRHTRTADHSEADMWSRVQAKRARRVAEGQTVETSTESSVQPTINSTEHIPKYILDLYNNLTNKSQDVLSSAKPAVRDMENTIRALPTTGSRVVCGQYNFSLASQVPSEEHILRSELRLYKRPKEVTSADFQSNFQYRVKVYRYKTGHNEELVTSKTVSATEDEEVFTVLSAVQDWKEHMENHPEHSRHGFRLEIVGEDCESSHLQFVHSKDSSDAHKQPQLVIYSYDPKTEAMDYQSILQDIEGEATPAPKRRRRRSAESAISGSSTQQPSCGIHELNIEAGHLESLDFFAGYNILAPRKYNAGICGGMCQKRYPFTFQHSSFVHLLINKNTFADKDYNFTQSCSPVKYSPIDVLMAKSNSVVIKRFADMVINRCECIDVVSFEGR